MSTMPTHSAQPLQELQLDLLLRSCSFLPQNEIACTARLLCKAAARHFASPQHRAVRLSQPVPPHAFAWRFGLKSTTGAVERCSKYRKVQLIALTAASGSVANLVALRKRAGGQLWHFPNAQLLKTPYRAAAAAGHMHVIKWLLEHHYPMTGCHEAVLCDAVRHCSLAGAQWLLQQGDVEAHGQALEFRTTPRLLAAAAASTHDARAKLRWLLLERGCPADGAAAEEAARAGDLDTLQWLARHGCGAPDTTLLRAAADGGATRLLERLLERESLGVVALRRACEDAAAGGHAAALRALLPRAWGRGERGAAPGADAAAREQHLASCLHAAALQDSVEALACLWEEHGARPAPGSQLFGEVAAAGHVEAARWLWERRAAAPLRAGEAQAALAAAVSRCCLPVMAFLVEVAGARLSDLPATALRSAVEAAAKHSVRGGGGGHLAALAWLAARGCSPAAACGPVTVLRVMSRGSLEVAQWLHAAGQLTPQDIRRDSRDMLAAAAGSGCVALVEWLAARGCPVGRSELELVRPGGDADMARCLQRLVRRRRAKRLGLAAAALGLGLGVACLVLGLGPRLPSRGPSRTRRQRRCP